MSSKIKGKEVSWNDLRKKHAWTQHNNTNIEAKVSLRKALMQRLKGEAVVLDAFCGTGKMHDALYQGCFYKGLDCKEIHDPTKCEVVDDNKMWIKNNAINDYNFFDLDAHTSPWEAFHLVTRHKSFGIKHKRIAFALTDGAIMKMKLSGCTTLQKAVMQLPRHFDVPCLQRHYNFFVLLMLKKAADQIGWKLEMPVYQSFNARQNVSYIGCFLYKSD